ncbi:MAG: SPFH domain-containing protein, partial [Anaerolineae bacterium]|nr:SPFH domain-containing protein [Anaerolineae bacterium]
FERIIEPVDLRTQQRMFEAEATTRDGIHLNLSTAGSFQLDAGDRCPRLGESLPCRTSSVYRALHARPLDIVRRQEEEGEIIETRNLRRWDELYEITAAHVTRDVIEQYRLDELLYDPEKSTEDPRVAINKLYKRQMTRELHKAGTKVLKVDVGNLIPAKREAVFERRILHWQAQWQRKMLEKLGIAEADIERIRLEAQADAQIEMIHTIGEAISEVSGTSRETVVHSVILRFINSLNEMAARPEVRSHLPPEVPQAVRNLPHIIGRAE